MSLSESAEVIIFGERLTQFKVRFNYDERVHRVWDTIEREFSDSQLRVPAVARACAMSPRGLNQSLRLYVRLPFHRILTMYRVYRAACIIISRNESLLNVALDVGLDLSSLERNFSAYFGMTLRDFKRVSRESLSGVCSTTLDGS